MANKLMEFDNQETYQSHCL